MKIGIIGGGMTGLTLAYFLSKEKKYEVTLMEKAPSVGGLLAGFQINGTYLERYYHHLFKTDKDILDLIDELGLSEKMIWSKDNTSIFYEGHIYPFITPKDLLNFKPLNFIGKVRTGLMALYLQRQSNCEKFENITASKWIKNFAGQNAYSVIWEPLLKGKFGAKYDDVSMGWLWARIHTRFTSRDKSDGQTKLGYMKGGFQLLIDELVSRCENNGVIIKTNEDINNLMLDKFDKVVATVPNGIFAKLGEKIFTKEYIDQLNSIDYYGAVCMILESNHKFTDYYWVNVNDNSVPFTAFVEHTNMIDKSMYGGKNVIYLAQYVPQDHRFFNMSDEEIKKEWFAHLNKINPDFKDEWVEKAHVFKAKNAQHIVTKGYRERIPAYKTPVNNLYLANFSQIYPEDRGTNFAVREGKKIFNMIKNEIN